MNAMPQSKNFFLSEIDLRLLNTCWNSSDHFLQETNATQYEQYDYYKKKKSETIGNWLASGLIAYRSAVPEFQTKSFQPISHKIGTERESLSHINSLIRLYDQLANTNDTNFITSPEDDFFSISLGECFQIGLITTLEQLVRKLTESSSITPNSWDCLLDGLTLAIHIVPPAVEKLLLSIWIQATELDRPLHNKFKKLPVRKQWLISKSIVDLSYQYSHTAASPELRELIKRVAEFTENSGAPAILAHSLQICFDMLSHPAFSDTPTVKMTNISEDIGEVLNKIKDNFPGSVAVFSRLKRKNAYPQFAYDGS